MSHLSFVEKAERTLIITMIISILTITLAPRVLWLYQASLGLLIVSTFLQIAVGNLPRDANFKRSAKISTIILSLVAMVFGLGILLVPVFSGLGR